MRGWADESRNCDELSNRHAALHRNNQVHREEDDDMSDDDFREGLRLIDVRDPGKFASPSWPFDLVRRRIQRAREGDMQRCVSCGAEFCSFDDLGLVILGQWLGSDGEEKRTTTQPICAECAKLPSVEIMGNARYAMLVARRNTDAMTGDQTLSPAEIAAIADKPVH
jgi:hypothetical protein